MLWLCIICHLFDYISLIQITMKNSSVLSLFTVLAIVISLGLTQSVQAQTSSPVSGGGGGAGCPIGYNCSSNDYPPTICPAGYTCTPITVTCPAGYTCVTVPSTVPGCPTGYTCTSNGSSNDYPRVSDATVTVTGQPTLTLTYDSSHGEAALTSVFNISVNGGTQGINLYQQYEGNVTLVNNDGKDNSYLVGSLVPASTVVGGSVDNGGKALFVVPPGKTLNFQLTASANPKQLFAGTYYASLAALGAVIGTDAINNYVTLYPAKAAQSNSVTIIGEVSPYISSVSPTTVSPGQTLALSGQRFSVRDILYIDNTQMSLNSINGSATSLSFTVPSLTNGGHSLYLNDPTTGASNSIGFQVQSSTSCYVFNNNLSLGSRGADVVALQTWLIANGFNIPALSSGRAPKGYFGITTATALKQYQASINTPATGFFGPLTRASINASCTNSTSSITVLSPTQSSTYVIGTPIPITWGGSWSGSDTFNINWGVGEKGGQIITNLTQAQAGCAGYGKSVCGYSWTPTFTLGPTNQITVARNGTNDQGVSGQFSVVATSTLGNSITASLDPSSPLSSVVQISPSTITPNVLLAVFDLQSQGTASTLRSLTVGMPITIPSGAYQTPYSLYGGGFFTNVFVKIGGQTYAETGSGTSTVTFGNLNLSLPANTSVPIVVSASVAQDTNGSLDSSNVSVNLPLNGISAVDANGNTVQVNQGFVVGLLSGSTITFNGSGVQVSNGSVGTPIYTPTNQANVIGNVAATFPFTFTISAGSSPVYISATPASAVTVISDLGSGSIIPDSSSVSITSASTMTGDTNSGIGINAKGSFIVPANSSRVFTVNATINNSGNTAAVNNAILAVNGIYYGSSPTMSGSVTSVNSESLYTSNLSSLQSPPVTLLGGIGSTTQQNVNLSLDPASPLASTLVYNDPSNYRYLKLPVLVFDLNNTTQNTYYLRTLSVGFKTAGILGTAYLYQGSNLVSSVTVDPTFMSAVFRSPQGVQGWTIPANTNTAYTVMVDATGAANVSDSVSTYIGSNSVDLRDSNGNGVNVVTGGAIGNLITLTSSTQQPTVSVYYPTANSTFTVGSPIQLGFSSSNALATFDVQLGGKAYGHDYGNVNAPESGARLNFTVPTDALPSNYSSLSGYQFQIYYNGSLVASSPSFTINSPTQTSQPPVISGGTFPTTLNVGQTGTWKVNASDPQNGSLSYSVNWGDTPTCKAGYICEQSMSTASIVQTSTFTHSYATAGTYNITFTVTDSAGLSAQTSTTVQVVAATTAVGPVFTINGQPSISKIVSSQDQNGNSTLTYTAGFNLQVQAVGEPVTLGLPNSPFPMVAPNLSFIAIYKNGTSDALSNYNPHVSYMPPSNVTLNSSSDYQSGSFTVGTNQTVTIPVTVSFVVTNPGTSVYGVKLMNVGWSSSPGPNQVTPINSSTPLVLINQTALTASIWNAVSQYLNSLGR